MGKKVKVISFALNGELIHNKTQEQMANRILNKLESARGYCPDLIVLPEAFLVTGGDDNNPNWETITSDIVNKLSEYAKDVGCYIIAPVYERVIECPGMVYNSTLLIDRLGQIVGKYRKMHTVDYETEQNHILPGDELPVFDTDFGRIGIQTCFDIGWRDSWKTLVDKGAKMIIWTAAYNGGNLLNTYAAYHMIYVVSSVRTEHAQIIDITGRTIAESAQWDDVAMADIDLEATLFHIDNQYYKIDSIRKMLGEKVIIRAYSDENVFTIESNDLEWPIERICKEFDLEDYKTYHEKATRMQKKWRKKAIKH